MSSLHLLFPSDTDMRAARGRLPGPRKRAVPLAQCRPCRFRRLPGLDEPRQAQEDPAGPQEGRRRRPAPPLAARRRHRRGRAGFFYQCYRTTYFQHGNPPYLSADFFHRAHRDQPDAFVLILAERDGAVAAALNLAGGDALYGRYWGATEYVPGLHFETCYMQAIAYCIAHGFARFEGGAQGEHKMARGLLPTPPGPPTGSPTRASPTRSNASWTRKPRRSKATWTNWKRTHRSSRTRPIVLVKSPPSNYPTKPTLAA